jgi:NADPH2:quinone reductase
MKAIHVTAYGDTDVLEMVDTTQPTAGSGQVVVKVEFAGVNYLDVQVRRGLFGIPTPFPAGFKGAGVITEVGPDVDHLQVGQRVVWAIVPGSYAEYVAVPAASAIVVPDEIELRTAVAVPVQGITAQYLVTDVHSVQPGEFVLVHAGAGGVGRLLVQLAKARGATVIATVSSEAKGAVARAAGADHVLGYAGFAARARELTDGTGVDVVYDGVGASTYEESVQALKVRGTLAIYGATSGPVPGFNPDELGGHSLTVIRPTFSDYTRTGEEVQARVTEMYDALIAGTVSIDVDTSLTLEQAAGAQTRLQNRATSGKLALQVH